MIKYLPSELIKKFAPEKKVKKLLGKSFNIKKTMLSMFDGLEFIDKKDITKTALKAANYYKSKFDTPSEALAESNLFVNRVQNTVIFQVHEKIKENYEGEFYKWLPSDAETPDPLHALLYGSVRQIGVGEMPGDRFGCRCGMEILTKENQLDL